MEKLIQGVHLAIDGYPMVYGGKFTREIFESLIKSYDPNLHEAPVVLGHDMDTRYEVYFSSKDNKPAHGWVTRLYLDVNGELRADLKITNECYEWIERGLYKKRSIAYYLPLSDSNPKKGSYYLRHLALLGANPPRIKGLEDIILMKEFINKEDASSSLKKILDEVGIVTEDIVEFIPEPTEENDFLIKEDDTIEGKFKTIGDEVYTFKLTKDENGGWQVESDLVTEQAEDVPEKDEPMNMEESMEKDKPMKMEEPMEMAESMASDEGSDSTSDMVEDVQESPVERVEIEVLEVKEANSELLKKLELLEQELERLRKDKEINKQKEIMTYCESLYEEGMITEGQVPLSSMIALFMLLSKDTEVNTYSEGSSPLDTFKKVMSGIKAVTYSEVATVDSPKDKTKPSLKLNRFSVADSATEDLTQKILTYKEENQIGDFQTAYTLYFRNKD